MCFFKNILVPFLLRELTCRLRRYLSLTPPEMCRKATHSGEVVRGQNPGGKMAPRCEGRDTESTGAASGPAGPLPGTALGTPASPQRQATRASDCTMLPLLPVPGTDASHHQPLGRGDQAIEHMEKYLVPTESAIYNCQSLFLAVCPKPGLLS